MGTAIVHRLRAAAGFFCVATIALGVTAGQSPVWAQDYKDYPSRTVQLIISYGPGTIGDVSMRIVAQGLTETLGKPFIIENRPSAGGVAAAQAAAQAAALAAPDGYTLLLSGNSYAIAAAWFKSLPYDMVRDFVSISSVATFDFLVATKKGSQFKTMQDVIAYAKANPGKLNIATLTPGTTQNLVVALLKVLAGIDVTAVPFRSSPEAVEALMRGDVDLDIDSYAPLRPMLDAGDVNVIATTGSHRVPYLTNIPTVAESGVAGFEASSWNGIAARAGTPQPIIDKLNKTIGQVLQAKDVQESGRRLGMEMQGSTPEALQSRLKNDITKWSAVIEKAHIPKQD